MMLLTVLLSPTDSSSFTEMARILPDFQKLNQEQLVYELLSLMVNNVIPIFFLIIPIMTASVMAASSFVGEKENERWKHCFIHLCPFEKFSKQKYMRHFCRNFDYVCFLSPNRDCG